MTEETTKQPIQKQTDNLFLLVSKAKAEKIIRDGPLVEGFADLEKSIYPLPDRLVGQFLRQTFGNDILRQIQLAKVVKDPRYPVFLDLTRSDDIKKANRLIRQGLLETHHGLPLAPDKNAYIKIAMILEGVDKEKDLKHLYKVRAAVGQINPDWTIITLYSFGVEKPEDFDYLQSLPLSDENKMKVYILSGLAHEVFHLVEESISRTWHQSYRKSVFGATDNVQKAPLVTEYVRRQRDIYRNGLPAIIREDMGETVRLFTANPLYLQRRFPSRYEFAMNHWGFLEADSAFTIVENLL